MRKAAARTPAELYEQAVTLEGSGQSGQAMRLYRQAANGGNGAATKKMWEMLRNQPGAEREAVDWQRRAYNLNLPGVPEPASAVRMR